MKNQIVIQAAFGAEPSAKDAVPDDLIVKIDLNHRVDVIAFQKELRLASIAGEAVEDKSEIPIVLIEPASHDLLDNVIRNQFSRRRAPGDLGGKLGMALDVPSKNVAHAHVYQMEVLAQHFRLRPLAAALDAHDYIFIHEIISLAFQAEPRRKRRTIHEGSRRDTNERRGTFGQIRNPNDWDLGLGIFFFVSLRG
jgi:hypothetical protein